MKQWFALVISIMTCWAAAMGCKGGGAPAASGPDVDFAVSQYSAAKVALQAGDLAAAKVEYEKVLAGNAGAAKSVPAKVKATKSLDDGNLDEALSEYEKTVAGTPDDPKANFGLGLIKLAQLGQGDVATAILDKFGQPSLKTSLVLGPDGYLAKLDKYHETCQNKPNPDAMPFGNLPKMYITTCDLASPYQCLYTKDFNSVNLGKFSHRADRLKKFFGTLLGQAKPELMTADIQKTLLDIEPVLKDVIAKWEIAEKDPNFSFTLPKELFFANEDVTIKHADLSLGIFALYGALTAIDFANSWTADMDLGKLIDTKGANGKIGSLLMQEKDVVPILNKFFTLKTDNHLVDAKINLQKALLKGQDALQQYLEGAAGTAIVVNDVNKNGVQELLTRVNEALASFDKNTDISNTKPLFQVNLGYLFANPPDANKIDIDPFVLETSYPPEDHIRPVESFFQKFMEGVSSISIGDPPKNIFSKAVKSKAFRNTAFATFIKLFNDPQYPSCKMSTVVSGGGGGACVPKCDGIVCGDDGCGGKCGVCGDPCIPKCSGKTCGNDGCGGSCGTCGANQSCSVDAKCVDNAPVTKVVTSASNFKDEDVLVFSSGKLQLPDGSAPKVNVASDQKINTVYVMCGMNVPPYKVQKFILTPEAGGSSIYSIILPNLDQEISGSPKFACTVTAIDANGGYYYYKLKLVAK